MLCFKFKPKLTAAKAAAVPPEVGVPGDAVVTGLVPGPRRVPGPGLLVVPRAEDHGFVLGTFVAFVVRIDGDGFGGGGGRL